MLLLLFSALSLFLYQSTQMGSLCIRDSTCDDDTHPLPARSAYKEEQSVTILQKAPCNKKTPEGTLDGKYCYLGCDPPAVSTYMKGYTTYLGISGSSEYTATRTLARINLEEGKSLREVSNILSEDDSNEIDLKYSFDIIDEDETRFSLDNPNGGLNAMALLVSVDENKEHTPAERSQLEISSWLSNNGWSSITLLKQPTSLEIRTAIHVLLETEALDSYWISISARSTSPGVILGSDNEEVSVVDIINNTSVVPSNAIVNIVVEVNSTDPFIMSNYLITR